MAKRVAGRAASAEVGSGWEQPAAGETAVDKEMAAATEVMVEA